MHTSGLAAVNAQLAACERAVVGSEASGGGFSEERLLDAYEMQFIAEANLKYAVQHMSRDSLEIYNTRHREACQAVRALITQGGAVCTPEMLERVEAEARRRSKG
jgi:hypothetical protein